MPVSFDLNMNNVIKCIGNELFETKNSDTYIRIKIEDKQQLHGSYVFTSKTMYHATCDNRLDCCSFKCFCLIFSPEYSNTLGAR